MNLHIFLFARSEPEIHTNNIRVKVSLKVTKIRNSLIRRCLLTHPLPNLVPIPRLPKLGHDCVSWSANLESSLMRSSWIPIPTQKSIRIIMWRMEVMRCFRQMIIDKQTQTISGRDSARGMDGFVTTWIIWRIKRPWPAEQNTQQFCVVFSKISCWFRNHCLRFPRRAYVIVIFRHL